MPGLGDDHVKNLDAATLDALIDAHGAALVLYARQWCRAPEDAVQEGLIDLVRQDPAPEKPAAWLYTTVRRRAMNLARAEGRREKHQRQAGEQRQAWFVPEDADLDDPVDYETLLVRLPRLEREIVVARIWGERSFAEIAALVKHPISTVHRRYHRALSRLTRMIHESEPSKEHDESELPLA